MKKVARALLGLTVFCAWGLVVLWVAAPESIQTLKTTITEAIYGEQVLYTIEDENVPLAGPSADSGKAHNGWLRVEAGQLVNEGGAPLQLRGMSSHGVSWYGQYTSRAAIQTTKRYGANVFRVAMYVDDEPGNYTLDAADQKKNKTLLYDAVDNTLALDMYAVVDWHVLRDGNPLHRLDCAVSFFDEVSKKYADEPGVIYEICNEPNGDTTWDDIRAYAEQIIPVIRQNAPNAVIVVGTPDYSADILAALESPLPYENIMYAYHYYSASHKDRYREVLAPAVEAGLPIFVTEWGFGSEEEIFMFDQEHGEDFLAYMQEHGISWVNWSLCNKPEAFSAIRQDVDKLSDWTWEDLSESGKIVFAALQGR